MREFKNKKFIITGANGGIGNLMAKLLAAKGANLILLCSDQKSLLQLQEEIKPLAHSKAIINYVVADFSTIESIKECAALISEFDNVDYLINLAGVMSFNSFGLEDAKKIELIYNVNVLAPMILAQAVLPNMVASKKGQIVNIGSIFGSIAFPYFAGYSSSKAALRSFSEALRRELDGSGVGVTYIAPRAVKTAINHGKVAELHKQTNTKLDEPETVVAKILVAIDKQKKNSYFGFPEKLFVYLNYLFPSLIDHALKKQTKIARNIL